MCSSFYSVLQSHCINNKQHGCSLGNVWGSSKKISKSRLFQCNFFTFSIYFLVSKLPSQCNDLIIKLSIALVCTKSFKQEVFHDVQCWLCYGCSVIRTLASHQCGPGVIPGWGFYPSAVSENRPWVGGDVKPLP